MRCAELLAVAFGDTIVDVAHLGEDAPPYRIGEGRGVRLPTRGEGLPDPASFDLIRAEAGEFWLGLTPDMTGVVLDASGRRALDTAGASERRLEAGETIWIARAGLRFRVRVVEAATLRTSAQIDWVWVASLVTSVCLALVMVVLSHLRPEVERIEDDAANRAVLARLLPPEALEEREELEPPEETEVPELEPEPRRPFGLDPPTSPQAPLDLEVRPRFAGSSRGLWVPPGPSVGGHGRDWDPVEAARHAGILGPLDGRPFLADGVFDPGDDRDLWASTTALTESTWTPVIHGRRIGSVADDVIGMGLYVGRGSERMLGHLGDRHEDVALCRGDCRPRSHRRPVAVSIGSVSVRGSLDPEVMRRLIRSHADELQACAEDRVDLPRYAIAATVDFAIYQGNVGSVVIRGELPTILRSCLKSSIARWGFPKRGGESNLVSVSVRLSR